jgi:hypothetical protein
MHTRRVTLGPFDFDHRSALIGEQHARQWGGNIVPKVNDADITECTSLLGRCG